MNVAIKIMNCKSLKFRRIAYVFCVGTFFAFLCVSPAAAAHPEILITTATAGGGVCPFYLWWNTTGNVKWPNYIFTELYDTNGIELSGYPVEDSNIYYIPANQTAQTSSATGNEPDLATGASTVVIAVSGQFNGDSSNPEPVGYGHHPTTFSGMPNPLIYRFGQKRFVPGQPKKVDVSLEIEQPNPNKYVKLKFVYSLLKKTDPDDGIVTPITQTDPVGDRHVFRRVRHAKGSTQGTLYVVSYTPVPPGHVHTDSPYTLNDIRVDLTDGIAPTDYVYLDVFVINLTTGQNYVVPRYQLQP